MVMAKELAVKKPINVIQTYQGIRRLANKITRCLSRIDQVIAILDPEAPGGYYVAAELFRHLSSKKTIMYPLDFILITGRLGKDRVVERVPTLGSDVAYVLLVDDASFSGRTLEIARETLGKSYRDLSISTATITTGLGATKKPDFYVYEVDEREVVFPWGLVDSTGEHKTLVHTGGLSQAIKFGYRVWGNYEEFALNEPCTARLLTVRPNQRLSLQLHLQRDELFIVLDKNACFQYGYIYKHGRKLTCRALQNLVRVTSRGGKEITLSGEHELRLQSCYPEKGHYVLIPRETWHRLSAPKSEVRVVEISFGIYDQDADIVRLEDDYGRKGLPGRF